MRESLYKEKKRKVLGGLRRTKLTGPKMQIHSEKREKTIENSLTNNPISFGFRQNNSKVLRSNANYFLKQRLIISHYFFVLPVGLVSKSKGKVEASREV